MPQDYVSLEFAGVPEHKPGLFPGRPWVVYFEGGTRANGKRAKRGMASFETWAEVTAWLDRCGWKDEGLPF